MSAYTATDTVGNPFSGSLNQLIRKGVSHCNEQVSLGRLSAWTIRRNSDGAIAHFRSDPGGLLRAGYSLDEIIAEFLDWVL